MRNKTASLLLKVILTLCVILLVVVSLATAQVSGDINKKLTEAAELGNIALVKKLLAQGANPNYMETFRGQKTGFTALMRAATGADSDQGNDDNLVPIVKILLAQGANANLVTDNGVTALQQAAASGRYEIVVLLLKAGAVNTINVRSKGGRTALGWALVNAKPKKNAPDYAKIINILRQHGAKE